MKTTLEFSRGTEQRIQVLVDTDRLMIMWEAKNHSAFGTWSMNFTSIDELRAVESEIEQWVQRRNFVLVGAENE